MAKKSTDPRFAHLPTDRSLRITNIIASLRSEKGVKALDEAIADGIPINGLLNFTPQKTFLEYAIHNRNVGVMEYLIDRDHTLVHDQEALLGSCLFSKTCTEKLLTLGYSFEEEMKRDPLFFNKHALAMDCSYIKDFASIGADLNSGVSFYNEDMPLLVQAGRYRFGDFIKAMLDAGADPAVRGRGGVSFMHTAVTNVKTYSDPQYDLGAEVKRFQSILEVAAQVPGALSLRDEVGRTPLHLAAKMGYINKVSALIEAGADPTIKDDSGRTPEMLAKAAKKDEIVQLLKACRVREAILDVARHAPGNEAGPR